MTRRPLVLGTLLILATACAPAATSGDPAATGGELRPTTQADVISAAELTAPGMGDVDLLSAIRKLRPAFLNYRGPVSASSTEAGKVRYSLDGGTPQTLETISTIRASEVAEIRYLSASSAAQRFGTTAYAGPVILVKRR